MALFWVDRRMVKSAGVSVRMFLSLLVVLTLLAPPFLGQSAAPAVDAPQELLPLTGQPISLQVPIDAVDSVATDDAARRVYVASSTANAVAAIGYDGTIIGTASVPGLSSLTVRNGRLFAVQAALGNLVELSTATLQPTVLVSGLYQPMGLAFNGSNMVTTVGDPNNPFFDTVIEYVGTTNQAFRFRNLEWGGVGPFTRVSQLFMFPEVPGVLFGSDRNQTYRAAPSNSVITGGGGTEIVPIENGHLFVGSNEALVGGYNNSYGYTVDPVTFVSTTPAWGDPSNNWSFLYFRGATASRDVVVQHRSDSAFSDRQQSVELRVSLSRDRAVVLRQFKFETLGGSVFVTKDSSRVLFLEQTAGRQQLRIFPGVGREAAVQASASTVARTAVVGATGATVARPAAPTTGDAPVELRTIRSLWFDPTTGLALAADPANGVVGVFGSTGRPLRSIGGLGAVYSFATVNGAVYSNPTNGAIRRLGLATGGSSVVCSAPGPSAKIIAAAGRLWFLARPIELGPEYLYGIDPTTCDQVQLLLETYPSISDPVGDSFFVGFQRFNAATMTFSPGLDALPHFVLRNGTYVSAARQRFDFATNTPSGAFYPDGDQYDVSGGSPTRVASKQGVPGSVVSIYEYNAPGTRLRRFMGRDQFILQNVAFRPGTNELWVSALNLDTKEAIVGPFIDAGTGALLAADPVPRPAGWPSVLTPSLVATEIAALESAAAPEAVPSAAHANPLPPAPTVGSTTPPPSAAPESSPESSAAADPATKSGASPSVTLVSESSAVGAAPTPPSTSASTPPSTRASAPVPLGSVAPTTRQSDSTKTKRVRTATTKPPKQTKQTTNSTKPARRRSPTTIMR